MRRAIADGTLIVGAVFWSIVVVRMFHFSSIVVVCTYVCCYFSLLLFILMMLCLFKGLLLNSVSFVFDFND